MTSISTSGAASITPNAFLTGREIGAMTARALTPRTAGVVLMLVSSFDTVPSHEPRPGPVGRHRLDQPAAGILGRERNALGLPRLDRQRVEPERLPAVVEPVQQAKMVAVQMEDGGDFGAVSERQHHRATGFCAKG